MVPGAQVVAVNVGTRDTYEATTNAEGYYNIQFVRTGTYEITVTLSGFQTFKATRHRSRHQPGRSHQRRHAGRRAERIGHRRRPRRRSSPPTAPRISETIGKRAVVELPLNGRNVWSLASTTPGVLGGLNSDIGLSFRGAGQREIQNSLSLDGINSSANLLAATSMRPIADAVTEIQVQTGSTSAEYGAYLGVHINVVTKSGTNTPHGSLFEFFQDDALDERGYFENRANPKNPRRRNQFGFQMDGPVVFPKLYDGRNKTFFMAAYEGVRAEALSSPIVTVPTALMRQGNFSEISGAIRNPIHAASRTPATSSRRRSCRRSRAKLLRVLPGAQPAGHRLQPPDADSEHGQRRPAPRPRRSEPRQQGPAVTVRYNWHDSVNSNPSTRHFRRRRSTQPRVNKNTLVSYTHTLRPTLLNDFRIGYHRVDFDTLNHVRRERLSHRPARISAFPASTATSGTTIRASRASTSAPSAGSAAAARTGTSSTRRFSCRTSRRTTRGSHNVRAGFDLRRLATGRRAANDPRGRFDFTGDMTGHAVADFMLGLPRTVIPPTDQIQGHVGGWRNGFFVNDVWQASRDLTLSLGLRYELNTPVQTYAGLASMLAEDFETIIPTSFPAEGFEFHDPNYKDIAPRLGATYRLSEKTVLRAGLRDLLQPEPDELVHVPDQQPADRRRVDVQLGSREPHAVVRRARPASSGRPHRRT